MRNLQLCKGLAISNAPRANASRYVTGFTPMARVNGVALIRTPAPNACLTSGFGMRNGRAHKGIDLQSKPSGPVVAAGRGTIVEARYRDDFGRYVLIDHGNNVYTRYAHLASYGAGVQEGRTVSRGQKLGQMGNTAAYRIPVHLHYEVLTGNYGTPKKSFGLVAVDILRAPSY
ncbi:MAG: M23 family metallopeptidase [Pseudomonadota bacterium]